MPYFRGCDLHSAQKKSIPLIHFVNCIHVANILTFLYPYKPSPNMHIRFFSLLHSDQNVLIQCLFYGVQHRSCHGLSQKMQAFYVIKLPCLGT
jgi:hypothetical protein